MNEALVRRAEAAAERLEKALQESQDTIRELHGARKDLIQKLGEIREFMRTEAEKILTREVVRQFAQLGKAIKIQMDRSVAHVSREFQKLEDTFLGKNHQGREPLEVMVRRARKARGLD